MELEGKIVKLLAEQSGQGKNGQWRKREYIIETPGQYPRKVCFNLWGDKIDQFPVKEGDEVKVSFDLESREFNGRWYTDVKAWRIEPLTQNVESTPPPIDDLMPEQMEAPLPPDEEDDLPF